MIEIVIFLDIQNADSNTNINIYVDNIEQIEANIQDNEQY